MRRGAPPRVQAIVVGNSGMGNANQTSSADYPPSLGRHAGCLERLHLSRFVQCQDHRPVQNDDSRRNKLARENSDNWLRNSNRAHMTIRNTLTQKLMFAITFKRRLACFGQQRLPWG